MGEDRILEFINEKLTNGLDGVHLIGYRAGYAAALEEIKDLMESQEDE